MYYGLDMACRWHSSICSYLFVLDVSAISPFLDCLIYFGYSNSFLLDRLGLMSLGCYLAHLLSICLSVVFHVFLDKLGRLLI